MKLVEFTQTTGVPVSINPYMIVHIMPRKDDSGSTILKLWDTTFDVREGYPEVKTKLNMAMTG